MPRITGPDLWALTKGVSNLFLIHKSGEVSVTSTFTSPEPDYVVPDLELDGDVLSAVGSAYSPKYIGTGDETNVMIVTTTSIYYVEDIANVTGSRTVTLQHTFADASNYRTIATERGTPDWYVIGSYYPGTGTKACYTTDSGDTWDEVTVSGNVAPEGGPASLDCDLQWTSIVEDTTQTPDGEFTYDLTSGNHLATINWYGSNPYGSTNSGAWATLTPSGDPLTSFKIRVTGRGPGEVPLDEWLGSCPGDSADDFSIIWFSGFDVSRAATGTNEATLTYTKDTYSSGNVTSGNGGWQWRSCARYADPWDYEFYYEIIEVNGTSTTDPERATRPGVHVSGKTAGLCYIAAFDGSNEGDLYVSDDYGATWSAASSPGHDFGDYLGGAFHFSWDNNSDELHYYFGKYDGSNYAAYRCETDGTTLTDITPSGNYGPDDPRAWGTCQVDRNYVALCGQDASGNIAVFRSASRGNVWTTLLPAVPRALTFVGVHIADDPAVMYFWGPRGVALSNDSGASIYDRTGNASTSEVILIGGW